MLRTKKHCGAAAIERYRADLLRQSLNAIEQERDEARRALNEAGEVLGAVCVASTLAPGESLKDPPRHAAVSAILSVIQERDIARSEAELERDEARRVGEREALEWALFELDGPGVQVPPDDSPQSRVKARIAALRFEAAKQGYRTGQVAALTGVLITLGVEQPSCAACDKEEAGACGGEHACTDPAAIHMEVVARIRDEVDELVRERDAARVECIEASKVADRLRQDLRAANTEFARLREQTTPRRAKGTVRDVLVWSPTGRKWMDSTPYAAPGQWWLPQPPPPPDESWQEAEQEARKARAEVTHGFHRPGIYGEPHCSHGAMPGKCMVMGCLHHSGMVGDKPPARGRTEPRLQEEPAIDWGAVRAAITHFFATAYRDDAFPPGSRAWLDTMQAERYLREQSGQDMEEARKHARRLVDAAKGSACQSLAEALCRALKMEPPPQEGGAACEKHESDGKRTHEIDWGSVKYAFRQFFAAVYSDDRNFPSTSGVWLDATEAERYLLEQGGTDPKVARDHARRLAKATKGSSLEPLAEALPGTGDGVMLIEWVRKSPMVWHGYALGNLLRFTIESWRSGEWTAVVDGHTIRQGIADPNSLYHASEEAAKEACERRLRAILDEVRETAKC